MPKRAREGALTELLQDMGRRLRELRRSAGLTQEQAAQAVGVSAQAVRNWEAGRHEPNAERLKRLATLYGVTMEELLGSSPRAAASDEAATTAVQFRGYLMTGPQRQHGPVEGDTVPLSEFLPSERSRTFTLVVSGDSLSAHGIQNGDLILVDPDGELAVSSIEPCIDYSTLSTWAQVLDGREVELTRGRSAQGSPASNGPALGRVVWHLTRM